MSGNGAKKDKSFIAMLILIIVCACLMVAAVTTLGVGMSQGGTTGENGSHWYTSADGEKDDGLGVDGDFYLDDDGNVFVKKDGKWSADSIVNLKGPAGADGVTPHIDEETGHWFIGNEDTGISATGKAPSLGVDADGFWTVDGDRLVGADGKPVRAKHTFAVEDGKWVIDGEKTDFDAVGSASGSAWSSGSTVPQNSEGENGDFFLHIPEDGTPAIYEKQNGAWSKVADLLVEGGESLLGPRWFYGTTAPNSVEGAKNGDFYVNTESGDVYQMQDNAWGTPLFSMKGQAVNGKDGTKWYVGEVGLETAVNGVLKDAKVGDFYLDRHTWTIYQKTGEGDGTADWSSYNSIKPENGTPGADGTKWYHGGTDPKDGEPEGVKAGDYYLHTGTGMLYTYNGTSWDEVVKVSGDQGLEGPRGNTWYNDSTDPVDGEPEGVKKGDFYFNTETGDVYIYGDNSWGEKVVTLKGASGTNGANGKTWYSGPAAPDNGTGSDGDFYFNETTGQVSKKVGDAWQDVVNLSGARGTQWFSGPNAPANNKSAWEGKAQVGDFYYDSLNNEITKYEGGETWTHVATLQGGSGSSSGTNDSYIFTGDTKPAEYTFGDKKPTVGDLYFDTTTREIYVCTKDYVSDDSPAEWGEPVSLRGATGSAWHMVEGKPVTVDPTNETETKVENPVEGDYYLDTLNGGIYQYKDGSFGTSLGNLKGERGVVWFTDKEKPTEGMQEGDLWVAEDGKVYKYENGDWSQDPVLDLKGKPGEAVDGTDGSTWHTGTEPAAEHDFGDAEEKLKDGDFYLDTTKWEIYVREGGAWNKKGSIKPENGTPGADGKTWYYGAEAPETNEEKPNFGQVEGISPQLGDFYLDVSTGDLYVYQTADPLPDGYEGKWTWHVNMKVKGDKGSVMYYGTDAPSLENPEGAVEGDYYLWFTSDDEGEHAYLYQLTKQGEDLTWGDKLVDLQGKAGVPGRDGTVWFSDALGTDGNGAPEKPDPDTGLEGDYFYDTAHNIIYKKGADGWSELVTIHDGAAGATWTTGNGAPPTDANVGDLYLDLDTYDIYKYVDAHDANGCDAVDPAVKHWHKIGNIKGQDATEYPRPAQWFTGTATVENGVVTVDVTAPEGGFVSGDLLLDTADGAVYKYDGANWSNVIAGLVPYVDKTTGNWFVGGHDTGVSATTTPGASGQDGETPFIGPDGNWWIGKTNTGVKAQGPKGDDGNTPYIGENGNWVIGGEDTKVPATGADGQDGATPEIKAGEDGVLYWFLNGVNTHVPVTGADGQDGTMWFTGRGIPVDHKVTADDYIANPGKKVNYPGVAHNGDFYFDLEYSEIYIYQKDSTELEGEWIKYVSLLPHINEEGNWVVNGKDTKVPATGAVPEITITDDGYWKIGDTVTDKIATPKVELRDGYWYINGEPTGVRVNTILTGGGAPDNSLGIEGDLYLDITSGQLYKKEAPMGAPSTAATWQPSVSLKGSQGDKGDQGVRGSKWFVGTGDVNNENPAFAGETIQKNDLYLALDSENFQVYQYDGTEWKAVTGLELKGNPGIRGSKWFVGVGNATEQEPDYFGDDLLDGDYYLDAETGNIWRYNSGKWTSTGLSIRGKDGVRGTMWWTPLPDGSHPTEEDGVLVGDFLFVPENGDVYQYTEEKVWKPLGSIKGADGAKWILGELDLNSSENWSEVKANAGDFYLNTKTYEFWQLGSDKAWEYVGSLHASEWKHDAGAPEVTNPAGIKGDYYIDTETGNYYRYDGAKWDLVGCMYGKADKWFYQSDEPTTGKNGDYWLDRDAEDLELNGKSIHGYGVYHMEEGAWKLVDVLETKPVKDDKALFSGEGTPDTAGITNAENGDLYIDTTTGDVYEYTTDELNPWKHIGNIKGEGTLWIVGDCAPEEATGDLKDKLDAAEVGSLYIDMKSTFKDFYQKQSVHVEGGDDVITWVPLGHLTADRGTNIYPGYANPNFVDKTVYPGTPDGRILDSREGDFYFQTYTGLPYEKGGNLYVKTGLTIWLLGPASKDADLENLKEISGDDDATLGTKGLYWHIFVDLSKEDPVGTSSEFDIPDLDTLREFRNNVNDADNTGKYNGYTFNITDDIEILESDWEPIKDFAGTLNGNGHTVSGLKCSGGKTDLLFSKFGAGAKINGLNVQIDHDSDCDEYMKAMKAPYFLADNLDNVTITESSINNFFEKYAGMNVRAAWGETMDNVTVSVLGAEVATTFYINAATETALQTVLGTSSDATYFILESGINYVFDHIKFVGNTYIDVTDAKSVTVNYCYADVDPIEACLRDENGDVAEWIVSSSWSSGLVAKERSNYPAFIVSRIPEEDRTVGLDLTVTNSTILSAQSTTYTDCALNTGLQVPDPNSLAIYIQVKVGKVKIEGNVFGSEKAGDRYAWAAVKFTSMADDATLTFKDNEVYGVNDNGQEGRGANKLDFAAFALSDKDASGAYTAKFESNTVNVDVKPDGKKYDFLTVTGTGHAQVYLIGDGNSITGSDVHLFDAVTTKDDTSFDFIAFNASVIDGDEFNMYKGYVYLGDNFGAGHEFGPDDLGNKVTPGHGHDVWIIDLAFEYPLGFTQHVADYKTFYYVNNENGLASFRDMVNGFTLVADGKYSTKKINEKTPVTFEGKTVKLTADIELDSTKFWVPIGITGYFIHPGSSHEAEDVSVFKGTFDGAKSDAENYKISGINLVYNYSDPISSSGMNGKSYGLFGYVVGATIQNLDIENVEVNKGDSIVVAGGSGTMQNVNVSNFSLYSEGAYVGVLVGRSEGFTVTGCSVDGTKDDGSVTTMYGADHSGILVGWTDEHEQVISGNTITNVKIYSTSFMPGGTPSSIGAILGHAASNTTITGNTLTNVYVDATYQSAYEDNCVGALVGSYSGNAGIIITGNTGDVHVTSNTQMMNYGIMGSAYSSKTNSSSMPNISDNAELTVYWNGLRMVGYEFFVDDLAALQSFAEITTYYNFANEKIYQTADINLETVENWTPIGTIAYAFRGTYNGEYDGVKHRISNLTMNHAADKLRGVGFFGAINSATIENLILDGNIQITGFQDSGALVGYADQATISNIAIEAEAGSKIKADQQVIGGVVGNSFGCTLTDITSNLDVESGADYVGGIVGKVSNGTTTIKTVTYTGTVLATATNDGITLSGGIVGSLQSNVETEVPVVEIDDAHFTGTLAVKNHSEFGIGFSGLVGIDTLQGYTAVEREDVLDVTIKNSTSTAQYEDRTNNWSGYQFNTEYHADGSATKEALISLGDALALVSLQVQFGYYNYEGITLKLTQSVDMTDVHSWKTDVKWYPIGTDSTAPFKGTFDGQGYTISGFDVTISTDNNKPDAFGLFGFVENATIKNLVLDDANVSGTDNVGAVIGVAKGDTTVTNVLVKGTVTANPSDVAHARSIGAIVGAADGTLTLGAVSFKGTLDNKYTADNLNYLVYNYGLVGSALAGAATDEWADGKGVLPAANVTIKAADATGENAETGASYTASFNGEIVATDLGLTANFFPTGTSTKPIIALITVKSAVGLANVAELVNHGVSFKGETVMLGKSLGTDMLSYQYPDSIKIGKDDSHVFEGTFNGLGNTIPYQYGSLFGYTDGATIMNVKFADEVMQSKAALVENAVNTTITNVTIGAYVMGVNGKGVIMASDVAAAPFGIVGTMDTATSITSTDITIDFGDVTFTAEVDEDSNSIVSYVGDTLAEGETASNHNYKAVITDEIFRLGGFNHDVNNGNGVTADFTFTGIKFTGNSYIQLCATVGNTHRPNVTSVTVTDCYADVSPEQATSAKQPAFIVGYERWNGKNSTKLVFTDNVVYSATSVTEGSFSDAALAIFSWSPFADGTVISGNTFGSADRPYHNAIIKILDFQSNLDHPAKLTFEGNTFYTDAAHLTEKHAAIDLAPSLTAAYEVWVKNNTLNINTVSGAETDYTLVSAESASGAPRCARVFITADNKVNVNGEAVKVDFDLVSSVSTPNCYDFIGYNVVLDDDGMITKGDFIFGHTSRFESTQDEEMAKALDSYVADSAERADIHIVIGEQFGRRLSDLLAGNYDTYYPFALEGVKTFAELVNGGLWSGASATNEKYTVKFSEELAAELGTEYEFSAKDFAGEGGNWTPIGTKDYPFKGTFDGSYGDGVWMIKDLTYTGSADAIGFFGYTNGATICNLEFTGGKIEGEGNTSRDTGVLVAHAVGGEISNITVDNMTLNGYVGNAGGVAGYVDGTELSDIHVHKLTVSTTYTPNVGAVVGIAKSGKLSNIYVGVTQGEGGNYTADSEPVSVTGSVMVGGVVGVAQEGITLNTVYSAASVKASSVTEENSLQIGGIVGALTAKAGETFSVTDAHFIGSFSRVGWTKASTKYANYGLVGDYTTADKGTVTITSSNLKIDHDANGEFKQDTSWNEEGVVKSEYQITGLEGFKFFRDQVNGGNTYAEYFQTAKTINRETIHLMTDIDLGNEEWKPIGYYEVEYPNGHPTAYFSGIFTAEKPENEKTGEGAAIAGHEGYNLRGDSYTISGLKVTGHKAHNDAEACSNGYNMGLFGWAEHAVIMNLNIVDAKITGHDGVGVVVGTGKATAFQNVTVANAEVVGHSYVGGIAGHNDCSEGVWDMGTEGYDNIQVVGFKGTAIPEKILVSNAPKFNHGAKVGGLVGYSKGAAFTNNLVADATLTAYKDLGGLAGIDDGTNLDAKWNTVRNTTLMIKRSGYTEKDPDGLAGYQFEYEHQDAADPQNVEWMIGRLKDPTGAPSHGVNVEGEPWYNVRDNVTIVHGDTPDAHGLIYDNNSWHIVTPEGLQTFKNAVDTSASGGSWNGTSVGKGFSGMTVYLESDVDLAELAAESAPSRARAGRSGEVANWIPIGGNDSNFQGTFDGQGHTIKNMVVTKPSFEGKAYLGFFGTLAANVVVKNLVFENATVTGSTYAGVLAGRAGSSPNSIEISNITIKGDVIVESTSGFVGGLVGHLDAKSVSNIHIQANDGSLVKGSYNVGGIGGYWACYNEDALRIDNSDVKIDVEGGDWVGGVVGRVTGAVSSSNVTAKGTITGTGTQASVSGFGSKANEDSVGTVTIDHFNFQGKLVTDTEKYATPIFFMGSTQTSELHITNSDAECTYLEGELENAFVLMAHADDEGTVKSGYGIKNLEGFKYFRDQVNDGNDYAGKWVWLVMDGDTLDLGGTEWTPIGTTDHPFSGHFDGNGKKITNLVIKSADHSHVGLFGFVGYKADGSFHQNISVENFTLENVDIEVSVGYVGAVVGGANGHTGDSTKIIFSNINVTGAVNVVTSGDFAGGFAGHLFNAKLDNIHVEDVTGKVSSADTSEKWTGQAGGIAGHVSGVEANDIVSEIEVEGRWAGAYAGCLEGATLTKATLSGNITGHTVYVGAVAGSISDGTNTLNDVHYTGTVSTTAEEGLNLENYGVIGAAYSTGAKLNVYRSDITNYVTDGYNQGASWDDSGNVSGNAEISNVEGLKFFREQVNAGRTYENYTVTLGSAEYDLSDEAWAPIGDATHAFKGTFNGGNNTISGLKIEDATARYSTGLFGNLNGATVYNLTIDGADINAPKAEFVGVLASGAVNSTITNVTINNAQLVGGTWVGGVVGHISGTTKVTECKVTGGELKVQNYKLGGVVGFIAGEYTNSDVFNNVIDGVKLTALRQSGAGVDDGYGMIGGILGGTDEHSDATVSGNKLANVTIDVSAIAQGDMGQSSFEKYAGAIVPNGGLATYSGNAGSVTVIAPSADMTNKGLSGPCSTEEGQIPTFENNTIEVTWNGLKVTAEEYHIADEAGLKTFRNMVNGGHDFTGETVYLDESFSLTEESWTPIGGTKGHMTEPNSEGKTSYVCDNPFKGTFDGNGNTISDLTINDGSLDYAGLFGYIVGGTIKDLHMENVNITAHNLAGALVGSVHDGKSRLTDITVTDVVISGTEQLGGLVGNFYQGIGENLTVEGKVEITGNYKLGGLAGGYSYCTQGNNLTVNASEGSFVKATHKEDDLEGDSVGGVIGFTAEENMTLTNLSASNLTVSGTRSVGGIVGKFGQKTSLSGVTLNNVTVDNTETSSEYAQARKDCLNVGGVVGEALTSSSITVDGNNLTNVKVNVLFTYAQPDESVLTVSGTFVPSQVLGAVRSGNNGVTLTLSGDFSGVKVTNSIQIDSIVGGCIREVSVSSAEQLVFIHDNYGVGKLFSAAGEGVSFTINLLNDIDMNDLATEGKPYEWQAMSGHWMTFNGNGHAIKNLNAIPNADGQTGLFGYSGGCKISGLTIDGFTGRGSQVGVFAGNGTEGATLVDCHIAGEIDITYVNQYGETYGGVGAAFGVVQANVDQDVTIDSGCVVTIKFEDAVVTPWAPTDYVLGYADGGHTGSHSGNNGEIKVDQGAASVDDYALVYSKEYDGEFVVYSVEGLEFFRGLVNDDGVSFAGKTVKLAHNIELGGVTNWTPIGTSEHPFFGTFDGQGNVISDLSCTSEGSDVGLFGFASQYEGQNGGQVVNAYIKNLKLVNVTLKGASHVAGVVGTLVYGGLENITVSGSIHVEATTHAAAVVGLCYGELKDIHVDGDGVMATAEGTSWNIHATQKIAGGIVGGFAGTGLSDLSAEHISVFVDGVNEEKPDSTDVGYAGGIAGVVVEANVDATGLEVRGVQVGAGATNTAEEQQQTAAQNAGALLGAVVGGNVTVQDYYVSTDSEIVDEKQQTVEKDGVPEEGNEAPVVGGNFEMAPEDVIWLYTDTKGLVQVMKGSKGDYSASTLVKVEVLDETGLGNLNTVLSKNRATDVYLRQPTYNMAGKTFISLMFSGHFHGNGATINFEGYQGLFSSLNEGAHVENLTLNVTNGRKVPVVETVHGSETQPVIIENVVVNGSLTNVRTVFVQTPYGSAEMSGDVKEAELIIKNCENHADVTNDESFSAPGVTAFVDTPYGCSIRFEDCLNTGNLTAVSPRESHGAAFVRYPMGGSGKSKIELIRCKNTGAISTTSVTKDGRSNTGGLVATAHNGASSYYFEDCVNEGDITATTNVPDAGFAQVGGFVGRNNSSITIVRGVNTGNVSAHSTNSVYAYAAGLVGCGGATVNGAKVSGTITATSESGSFGAGALFGNGGNSSSVSNAEIEVALNPLNMKSNGLVGSDVAYTGTITNTNLTLVYASDEEGKAGFTQDFSWDAEGAVTVGDYHIYNLAGLKAFRDSVNEGNSYEGATVYLEAEEIDLGSENWTPIGTQTTPFHGYFDGNGNTISNLTINDATKSYVGLFGVISGDNASGRYGAVSNLTLDHVNVTGYAFVGALTGESYSGAVFTNITVTNLNLKGTAFVAAISGHSVSGKAVGCTVEQFTIVCLPDPLAESGIFDGEGKVGGIMGYTEYYGADGCTVSHGTIEGLCNVGGIIGYLNHVYDDGIAYVWNCKVSDVTLKVNHTVESEQFNVHEIAGYIEPCKSGKHELEKDNVAENVTVEYVNVPNVTDESGNLHIYTVDGLKSFRDTVNAGETFKGKTVYLEADLDLKWEDWKGIGTSSHAFVGKFDGQNHTISNLGIDAMNNYAGLFGNISSGNGDVGGGGVHNLTIDGAKITKYSVAKSVSYVAIVAGSQFTTPISNIKVKNAVITGRYVRVGGISGHGYANISDCYVQITFTAGNFYEYVQAGGIRGANCGGRITNCYVEINMSRAAAAGGIVGFLNGDEGAQKIINCYVKGYVEGEVRSDITDYTAAGIVGEYYANAGHAVDNCYFDGTFGQHASDIVGFAYHRGSTLFDPSQITNTAWSNEANDSKYFLEDDETYNTLSKSNTCPFTAGMSYEDFLAAIAKLNG